MADQVRVFAMPDAGEGLTEGEILKWLVAVGDTVVVNQPLCEVETAKAAIELPSPYAGVVAELRAAEGQVVPVGDPIIAIAVAESPVAATVSTPPAAQAGLAANGAGSGPVLVGYGVTEASTRRRPRLPAADPHGTMRVEAGPPGEAVKPVRHGGLEVGRAAERALAEQGATVAEPAARVRAKPLVRKLARELGVDLAAVAASGPHGTVTRDDVRLAAEGLSVTPDVTAWLEGVVPASSVAIAAGEPGESEVREPVRGVRRLMAEAMTASAFSVPHVTEWVEVDVTRSIELLERMRRLPAYEGIRLSPLLLVARALIEAVRRTPIANSFFDAEAGEAGEVVVRRHVNLGIAAATPRGLVVPNVKGAQALALPDLARALNALVETAKAGRTTPADMSGGTITITNVGVFGVDGGTPIINPGEAAILCMGAVRLKPWVVGGHVVPRQVMELTLSFDHRHIDGAAGSIVLADVARLLEEPALYSV